MKIGNRIIFDQNGEMIIQLGEVQGDVLPRKEITNLDYIDLEYGEVDYFNFRIVGVDIETKKPILKEIEREKTQEEIIEELENQLLLNEDEKVGGIL